ncbi:hypothetical protein Cri9333_2186 [Crinalium epipsammum PCC 9333]|uniref:ParB domain protein nuclease n=1 Tax=Crinalium epipsammum PCC 9333 TaxID=1173022 RepID=K9VY79_9CYAN|nr:hypothetical protein [Crinalium epipsammum]AFZ13058.1 hypothetical protein Cri9333_2186 [Crinalium epipsammum PCC 9333]
MKLATSLVPVKKISSPVERSNFDENALSNTAKLILQAEGIINPLIVRRINLESYEVVEGHFEYYAAVRAREIEPRKGEMIGAFIIEPENETLLIEQAKYFRNRESDQAAGKIPMEPSAVVAEIITSSNNGIKEVTSQLQQIEKSLNEQLKKIENKVDQVLKKLNEELDIETANKSEIEEIMGNKKQGDAVWRAREYLKEQGRQINKENFKKVTKAPDKIKYFAKGTYEKLILVVNIPD